MHSTPARSKPNMTILLCAPAHAAPAARSEGHQTLPAAAASRPAQVSCMAGLQDRQLRQMKEAGNNARRPGQHRGTQHANLLLSRGASCRMAGSDVSRLRSCVWGAAAANPTGAAWQGPLSIRDAQLQATEFVPPAQKAQPHHCAGVLVCVRNCCMCLVTTNFDFAATFD